MKDIEDPIGTVIYTQPNGIHSASFHKSNAEHSNFLTTFARHKIVRGKEQEFEDWVHELNELQVEKFGGYRGVQVIRPTSCDENEYLAIYRYESYEYLEKFMASEERKVMLEKTRLFEEEPIQLSFHSLEYWFVDHTDEEQPATVKPPSKAKMAAVTFVLIWLQIQLISKNIAKIDGLPALVTEALGLLTIVLVTTYIAMPVTTQYLLKWWLFPDPEKRWYFFPKEKREVRIDKKYHGEEQREPKAKKSDELSAETSSTSRTSAEVHQNTV